MGKIVAWIIGIMLAALLLYAIVSGLPADTGDPFTPPHNPRGM